MQEQVGWRGIWKSLKAEAPHYATLLPRLPRLIHERLEALDTAKLEMLLMEMLRQQRQRNQWLMAMSLTLALAAVGLLAWLWAV